MTFTCYAGSKEVLRDGKHFADTNNEEDAAMVVAALEKDFAMNEMYAQWLMEYAARATEALERSAIALEKLAGVMDQLPPSVPAQLPDEPPASPAAIYPGCSFDQCPGNIGCLDIGACQQPAGWGSSPDRVGMPDTPL